MPLATTQLSGAPALHRSRQAEISTVAPGERLGKVVPTTMSDSGVVGATPVVDSAVVVGAAVVVVVGGAVVVGAEVVEVVVVGAAVVDVVVVGATVVVVVGGVSSAGSLAPAKVVGGLLVVVVVLVAGDGSMVVVVVDVVDVGDVSSAVVVVVVVEVGVPSSVGSSVEAASTWSDESDDSPRLVIAHTPSPPTMSMLTSKTPFIFPYPKASPQGLLVIF